MKTDNQVKEILKQGESERIEFKANWTDNRVTNSLLVAFANSNGGTILYGISDNGEAIGINSNINELEKIKYVAQNECKPPVKIETYFLTVEKKVIAIVDVRKSNQTHSTKRDEIFVRKGESTTKLLQTTLSNGTKVFTEYGNTSYLIDFNIPEILHPGQEKVFETIKLAPHTNTIRITFHWGDNSIKVLGAHMIEPNIFEFPPSEKITNWFLKFCVSELCRIECDKEVYISVSEIFRNEKIKKWSNFIAYSLIGISFLPLILSLIDFFTSWSNNLKLVYGPISIPLPIVTIFSLIILNKRISTIIERLSMIKLTTKTKYVEKGVSNPNSLIIKTLKIRFVDEFKKYAP
jgi:hypothetical protein